MKRFIFVIFVIFGFSTAFAQSKSNAAKLKRNFVDTINFEWINGHIVIPVEVGGKTRKYLYDTGAGGHLMSEDAFKNSKVSNVHNVVIGDYSGKRITTKRFNVDQFSIGKMVFNNTSARMHKFDHAYWGCYGIEGLIGMLYGVIVKIDLKNHRLIFTNNRKLFDTSDGETLPFFTATHSKPYIDLHSLGEKVHYSHMFDSGDTGLLAMSNGTLEKIIDYDSSYRKHIAAKSSGTKSVGINGLENESVKYLIRTDFNIFGITFKDLRIISTQKQNNFGSYILNYGVIILDNISHRITFIPYEKEKNIQISNDVLDFVWSYADGRFVIGLIWEESESYKYGLRKGFTILEVNGRELKDYCSAITWLSKELGGESFKIKVLDLEGEQQEFDIQRVKWVK